MTDNMRTARAVDDEPTRRLLFDCAKHLERAATAESLDDTEALIGQVFT
jgi:hypothetical protein